MPEKIRNLQPFQINGYTLTALILFIENPEHASLEPALEAVITDEMRPRIIDALSARLRNLVSLIAGEKYLYYSHYLNWNDAWDINLFRKRIQIGDSVAERVRTAIEDSAEDAPESMLWMNSRAAAIDTETLRHAIGLINMSDLVIGAGPSGEVSLLGLGAEAFGLPLPGEFNADVIEQAAAAAGLSATRVELPALPQSVDDLQRLQITVE